MAAAERIHHLAPVSLDGHDLAQALIGRVLTGYDVNLTATHMAATTLGLLSPTTRFHNMKIGRAFLGVDSGKAYLGSLEFLDQQPKMVAWPGEAQTVSQVDSGERMDRAEPADLVIMNRPFTRDSLQHDQFSRADKRKIKAREKTLFSNKPVHLSGNSFTFSNQAVGHSTEKAMHVIEQEYDFPRENVEQEGLNSSGHRELDNEVNQVWGYVAKITYSVAALLTLITAGSDTPDRTLMLTDNLWFWSIATGIFSMLLLSLGQDYFTTAVKIRWKHS